MFRNTPFLIEGTFLIHIVNIFCTPKKSTLFVVVAKTRREDHTLFVQLQNLIASAAVTAVTILDAANDRVTGLKQFAHLHPKGKRSAWSSN